MKLHTSLILSFFLLLGLAGCIGDPSVFPHEGDALLDAGADVSTGDSEPGDGDSEPADGDSEPCEPLICSELDCGIITNDCGDSLECSGCADGFHCRQGECICIPETNAELCQETPYHCGEQIFRDHCGAERPITCYQCSDDDECDENFSCSCIPDPIADSFCSEADLECGSHQAPDSCGGTQTINCGTCGDNDPCTANSCHDGSCSSTPHCPGEADSCGCTTCQDCTADNGWRLVPGSMSYFCNDFNESCYTRQEEYREYFCDGVECDYEVTDTRTTDHTCTLCTAGCSNGHCNSCEGHLCISGSEIILDCASCLNCTGGNGICTYDGTCQCPEDNTDPVEM